MNAIEFDHDSISGLVSIVIPTYCKDRFIGETLASIASQTYPYWELIVVEDASVGQTQQIVDDYARQHPMHRVDYSRNGQNLGAAHSRNVAFAKCRGEFVALLDADDRWFPDHLELSVAQLRSSGADVVYSSVEMVEDPDDRPLGEWGPQAVELAEFPESIFGRNFITPSATVMRREVLADVGAWNTAMKYCEDLDFWLRCIRAGKQFQIIDGCHCLYRKNHEGATTGRQGGTLEEFAEIVERFIPMPGTRESRIRRHVAKAFVRAANCHAKTDPKRDSSVDRARCAPLMHRAWRLRPYRLDYLWKSLRYFVADRLRRPTRQTAAPPAENAPVRAAA